MKTMYKEKDLRELYRVDDKYWRTGDVDILDKRVDLARRVDQRFWSEVSGITSIVTRKHLPISTLVDALKVLGFEMKTDYEEHCAGCPNEK